MITDLDQTIRTLLERRIPLDPAEVGFSFECPTSDWATALKRKTVNIYLYDVRENAELRVAQMSTENRPDRPTGRRRAPVRIDFAYLISAWAPEVESEHQLLWQMLLALFREPVIGEDVLVGALREAGPPTRTLTAQAELTMDQMRALWEGLGNTVRPAVSYTATLHAELDVLFEAPIVRTREIAVEHIAVGNRKEELAIGGFVRAKPRRGVEPGPVVGAQVTFPKLGITVRSGTDGRFLVPDVPRGRHRVRVVAGDRAVESEMEVPASSYDLEI